MDSLISNCPTSVQRNDRLQHNPPSCHTPPLSPAAFRTRRKCTLRGKDRNLPHSGKEQRGLLRKDDTKNPGNILRNHFLSQLPKRFYMHTHACMYQLKKSTYPLKFPPHPSRITSCHTQLITNLFRSRVLGTVQRPFHGPLNLPRMESALPSRGCTALHLLPSCFRNRLDSQPRKVRNNR